jgi:S1-C subfamily serine protease
MLTSTVIYEVFIGSVLSKAATREIADTPADLPLEEVIAQTKPAVVYLKGLEKAGTSFFVTETGVIATNAHVARDEQSLFAVLADGLQLTAGGVDVEPELDIALLKIQGGNFRALDLGRCFVRAAGGERHRRRESGRRHEFQCHERYRECGWKICERRTRHLDPDGRAHQSGE